MFGQNQNNVFGQTQNTFGSNQSTFNMNQNQQQQNSLFSQQQPTNSLFGGTSQPNNNNFFGSASANTSGFRMQQPQTNTFGTSSNSLFGGSNLTQQNNNTSTSLFGNNNNTSAFGMPSSTSAFGTVQQQTLSGTTVKFQPQTATDTMMKNGSQMPITIKLNCITCMREYESKCMDELRLEDYAANRKGSTSTANSLFSSSTMSTGTTSLFGQTSSANTFGNTATNSLFGATQNKPTGFGSMTPATNTTTSLFGSSNLNQNKPTGFGFGSTNTTNAFGQSTQPQQQTTLFGSSTQPQTNSLFGSTVPQQTTSLFGQTSQANTSLFGTNQATQNKPLFGGTTSTFGQSNTGTGLFGSSTNTGTTFGAPTSQPPLFGSTNPASSNNTTAFGTNKPIFGTFPSSTNTGFGTNTSTNLFGSTSTGTNAFGATNTAVGTGGLFGSSGTTAFGSTTGPSAFGTSNTGATGFGFGSSNTTFGPPTNNVTSGTTFGGFGTSNTGFGTSNTFGSGSSFFGNSANTSTQFGAQQQQQQQQPQQTQLGLTNSVNVQQILTRLETMPYGTMTQLPVDSSFQPSTIKTKFTTNPKTLNQYKINAKSQQDGPGIVRIPTSIKPANLLFDGLDDENIDSTKCANDIFSPKTSVKKLILNKKGDLSLTPSGMTSLFSPKVKKFQNCLILDSTPKMESTRIIQAKSPDDMIAEKAISANDTITEMQQLDKKIVKSPQSAHNESSLNGSLDITFGLEQTQGGDDSLIFGGSDQTDQCGSLPNCGIILTKQEYFTIPSLEDCDESFDPQNDTCIVESFTVTRIGYGSIYWSGPLDVKGLNLDSIVHIRRKEAIVYPDDASKPPFGQGLNRPAQITLDQVWPINKSTRKPIKDPEVLAIYAERLEAATHRLDATFKEYRPETGSWVFNVKHFSKYGLEDDDDDVEMEPQKVNKINENVNVMPLKNVPKQFNQETFVSKVVSLNNNENKNKPILRERNGCFSDAEIDPEFQSDKSQILSEKKNAEIERMQNILFNDHDEDGFNDDNGDDDDILNSSNVAKKAKSSAFIKNQTIITKTFPSSQIIPSSVRALNVKKRVLRINPQFEKAQKHINSLHMTPCCRVQFLNGSNSFCFVSGKSVFIMDCDIANIDTPENIDQLKEHLHREVLVKSSNSIIPEQRKCGEFVLSGGLTKSMSDLIEALFGRLDEDFPYARYQERNQRIKNWLAAYNKRLDVPMTDSWTRILHFLTTNEIEFAVTECQNSRNFRLGFLVASSASKDSKEKMLNMLEMWKLKKYDSKIDVELLKIYVLLAGILEWTTSSGTTIRVLENLHWTQQLLLVFLYCDEYISEYELFASNPVVLSIAKIINQPNDVEFHLLAQHSPWIALSCSDWFLNIRSWYLHETLSSYNVITQDWDTSYSDSIYLYMASQMTDLRWSIYFVVHLSNEYVRYRFVTDLLMKNAKQLFNAETELFLIDNFHIDEKIILDSKLVYSKIMNDPKSTAQLLLDNGNFVQAQRLLVNECFHELVINEDHDELQNLIDLLTPYQEKLQSTWNISGAGIFQIYLELCRFDKNSSDRKYATKLLEQFDTHQLKLTNKRQYLSQSLMATIANLVRHSLHEELSAVQLKSDFFDSRMISMIQTRLVEHRRQFPLNPRVRV